MNLQNQPGQPYPGLSPERLQLFIAGLSGLAADEVRKAKLLFLRNEISQLRALRTTNAGMGVAQGCFMIIPIFWPILFGQRKAMGAGVQLQVEQIRNALSVWADDLGRDAVLLELELDKAAGR